MSEYITYNKDKNYLNLILPAICFNSSNPTHGIIQQLQPLICALSSNTSRCIQAFCEYELEEYHSDHN